ncbi:MAG: hypothetical protein E4H28_06655 [Gemmatimonadales bacterium]|nr:MAG: hypothetical protein E4H28_06655 [Gemmatimonadales bacterium]
MRKYLSVLLAGAAVLLITPFAAFAQDEAESEPVFHYVTVTTFNNPGGEEGQQVGKWIEMVAAPVAKLNPNVLSYKVARHNWGSNSAQVVIIAEYADWAAIEGDCAACDAWFEANVPAEGTPEREEWDAANQAYFGAFLGHSDEIYSVNMDLAK